MRFLRLLRSVVVGLTLMLSVQTAARAQVNDLRIQRRLFELGGYIGMFFPASNHELLASGSSHKEFDTVAATLGGRLSFLPFYFFGAEVEGAITPTTTSNDKFAQIYHIRGHAFAQFPVWRTLCPFVLIGGGLLGVGSKASAVGSNLDLAFHWGAGAKYYIDDWLALRADFRQTISDGLGLKDANSDCLIRTGCTIPHTVDLQAFWRSNELRQFYRQGSSTTLQPIRATMDFTAPVDGKPLSDHDAVEITYLVHSASTTD